MRRQSSSWSNTLGRARRPARPSRNLGFRSSTIRVAPNCMQCLSFCLFELYGVSKKGEIQVQNQTNCKMECPACSRVCPEVAILFPKYRHSPINGDEVNADDMRREAIESGHLRAARWRYLSNAAIVP
jgi:NAD-dependent dihydropyrimidine dehydrogenase PreA subunit